MRTLKAFANTVPLQMGQVGSLLTGIETGRLVTEEGTYLGQYTNGRPYGRFEAEFTDSEVYEGEFVHGKLCGSGNVKTRNGDLYEGEF